VHICEIIGCEIIKDTAGKSSLANLRHSCSWYCVISQLCTALLWDSWRKKIVSNDYMYFVGYCNIIRNFYSHRLFSLFSASLRTFFSPFDHGVLSSFVGVCSKCWRITVLIVSIFVVPKIYCFSLGVEGTVITELYTCTHQNVTTLHLYAIFQKSLNFIQGVLRTVDFAFFQK
jgi:hypothetical protein